MSFWDLAILLKNVYTIARFHPVKMFTVLVDSSTKTARLLLKKWKFYNRHFAILVDTSSKKVSILTRWNQANVKITTYRLKKQILHVSVSTQPAEFTFSTCTYINFMIFSGKLSTGNFSPRKLSPGTFLPGNFLQELFSQEIISQEIIS